MILGIRHLIPCTYHQERGCVIAQFYQRLSIDVAEKQERYRLLTNDDGSRVVEYEWLSTHLYRGGTNSGQIRMPVAEFLSGEYDETAKSALLVYLDALAASG
jgi:hypothetical protein